MGTPSASHRFSSSINALTDLVRIASSGAPRFTRYESCAITIAMPVSTWLCLNFSISSLRERLRCPLPRRLGENLDAVAADLPAADQRLADFAGDRHMRAEQRTTRLADLCHREMLPSCARRCGLERIANFILMTAQSEQRRFAHLLLPATPRGGYFITRANCVHYIGGDCRRGMRPSPFTAAAGDGLGNRAVRARRQAARLQHAGAAARAAARLSQGRNRRGPRERS